MRHPARGMNGKEALELFSWHAFHNSCPKEEYLELSKKIVSYCGGLPFALEVLGSSLYGRPIAEWKSHLEKLKRIPEGKIIEKLKISFDGLDYNQKSIFLDIFCCFLGLEKEYVTEILEGFYARKDISVLHERCLITVEWGVLKMHDLIQEMGKTIISEISPNQPGRWSRLWNPEDVTDVLSNKSGTEEIEALSLHLPSSKKRARFRTKAFVDMKRLRLLRLNYVELTGSFKHFPKELRWLCWLGFPFEDIPKRLFNQPKLVALDLPFSKLRKWTNSKRFTNLKILDLSGSHELEESPDFSTLPNLIKLNFGGCSSLSNIHPSIGQLKNLTWVDFQCCHKLMYLPKEFCKLKSVETLYLAISPLRELPEGLGEMESLRHLHAVETAIKQFPNDLGRLISLQTLSIVVRGHSLPSLSGLSKLVHLRLDTCTNLRAIPDLPTNLEVLKVYFCPALEIMPDLSQMSNMRKLTLYDSPKVTEVPALGFGESLNSMTELHMEWCTNLTTEFRKNILQGWTSCGNGGIFLNEIYDIPEWFEIVSDSNNKVSFDVPQCDDRNFEGLTLCFLRSTIKDHSKIKEKYHPPVVTVVNCTKHTTLKAFLKLRDMGDGIFWQGHLSNDKFSLQGGDKTVILLEGTRVKKTGVNFIWNKPLKENMRHNVRDYWYEYAEAVPDWLHDESSPGPSHGASDNHPTNQMTTTTDEPPKRKRQKV